jgi:16S rRNA (uracil1498-N3)-methyltransferase
MEILTREWGEFFYAPPECRGDEVIELPTAEGHHLFDVLRAQTGRLVNVTDGQGMVYECEVRSDRRLKIRAEQPEFGEPTRRIVLGMAVLKGDGNKTVVDEATQLGAREIRFFQAERSEGRMDEAKVEKLARVALAATKQCGRARIPVIQLYRNLGALLTVSDSTAARLLAHPVTVRTQTTIASASSFELLIGPEGGFTDAEAQTAVGAGYDVMDLGERRLRAETAAAAAIARLL